jgi:hypothetical protein
MVSLSDAITEAVTKEYGPQEFLRRISEPYWFQAFSCVIGFDWHSSGTTTTACGALKEALKPEVHGIYAAGGKGRASRKTLSEIEAHGSGADLTESKITQLQYASRLSAKVDNSCVQDGFQLYHHSFFFTEKGEWAVVQQGMGGDYARRYHWLSDGVESFVEEPHSGISCDLVKEDVLDMTAAESRQARKVSLDLVNDNPNHLKRYLAESPQKRLTDYSDAPLPHLTMPSHHPVLGLDLGPKGFEVLKHAYEIQPSSYEDLVSLKGMGPKKIRALALVSELVYGAAPSWRDPVKYSFTHGGKDGFPYPVDRKTYDNSISFLKEAVEEAKLGNKEKTNALKRLNEFL